MDGERQAGFLLDRQGVHVGADRQDRARTAALDQADDAGPADAGAVRDAQPVKFACDDAGGAYLLEPQLRMGVQVAADLDQAGLDALRQGADGGGGIVGADVGHADGLLLQAAAASLEAAGVEDKARGGSSGRRPGVPAQGAASRTRNGQNVLPA